MYDYESNPEAKGVEYQVTTVDPTDPTTKGKVYQVHKVSEEVAATLGGKVYRARIINDPTEPTVAGKVYQIVLIGDPSDPAVKGKVYNAILTGGSQVVVVGPAVSPLVLPDAVAGELGYVKAFGGTEQNGTPTPDAPVDIVSNNGVLKARHESGLPTGYTLLDYIESTGTQYIDLGYKGNGNTKVEVKFKYHTATTATGSGRVFGSRTTSQSDAFAIGSATGVVYAIMNNVFWCYDSQPYYIDDTQFGLGVWKTVVFSATEHTIDGVSAGDDYNVVEFETPQNLKLFGFDNNGTMGYGQVDIARCKLWDNGVLIRDLVPCKNASNVVGMYDLVNDQFYNNDGTGSFVAGNPVDDLEIYTDGTVETINAHGKNLFDPTKVLFGYYISGATGAKTQNVNNFMSSDDGYIPCLPNTTYTFVGTNKTDGTYSKYNSIYFFDSAKNYLGASPYEVSRPTTDTTPSNCHYLQVRSNPLDTSSVSIQDAFSRFNWQLEQGSTATAYEPYFNGGPATAEMLLKVGDYQDEQEILSGAITRKVGVKVLDGTEDWAYSAGWSDTTHKCFYVTLDSIKQQTNSSNECLCSHFEWYSRDALYLDKTIIGGCISGYLPTNPESGKSLTVRVSSSIAADATNFKTWLADQYAAGTPVIIVYPLVTATTESVAGQPLQVQAGDNTLEITQASLDNLELEAQYNAAVSLTIQEVQDANLDNNVTVTIQ